MNEESDDCIVARAPCCGNIVFAAANIPSVMDSKTRAEIAKMVIEGLTIEHHTTEKVRMMRFGCKCKKVKP